DQTNGGGSSQGFGYTARALIERRVTANWFVGTAVDIQQAKDYVMMVAIVLLFVLSGFFRGFDMKMIESFNMTVPNWLELIHNSL
ncbi:cellulose synthase subunit BcsC-related outer membrane protein, partial [Salmonella enterica subsp. enterica serovar Montevideo]|nr:cellulose synthase subunit BcsC-related outer membrane protein [Salmonella enterica subsp. enterica serovar Montevideo]